MWLLSLAQIRSFHVSLSQHKPRQLCDCSAWIILDDSLSLSANLSPDSYIVNQLGSSVVSLSQYKPGQQCGCSAWITPVSLSQYEPGQLYYCSAWITPVSQPIWAWTAMWLLSLDHPCLPANISLDSYVAAQLGSPLSPSQYEPGQLCDCSAWITPLSQPIWAWTAMWLLSLNVSISHHVICISGVCDLTSYQLTVSNNLV